MLPSEAVERPVSAGENATSPLSARPRRIPDVLVTPAPDRTDLYVLKDATNHRYARLSDRGLFLWNLMDGEHTVRDLSIAYVERYGGLGVDAVLRMVDELEQCGFVEMPGVESRPAEPVQRVLPAVRGHLAVRDPDRVLGRLYSVFGHLYRPPVQLALLAVTLGGAGVFLSYVISGDAGSSSAVGFALFVVASLVLNGLVHEVGHALTTKRFGREVHAAGIAWYLVVPVLYVDTSDMWLEGKRQRMAVAAAGPAANFLLAGVAGCLLPFAGSGDWHAFLFTLATSGLAIGLFNLYPLYEFDGYYVLGDWLDVTNLRQKALAFLGGDAKSASTRRERLVFRLYGVAAVVHALAVGGVIFVLYRWLLQDPLARGVPDALATALGVLLAATATLLLLLTLWAEVKRMSRSA